MSSLSTTQALNQGEFTLSEALEIYERHGAAKEVIRNRQDQRQAYNLFNFVRFFTNTYNSSVGIASKAISGAVMDKIKQLPEYRQYVDEAAEKILSDPATDQYINSVKEFCRYVETSLQPQVDTNSEFVTPIIQQAFKDARQFLRDGQMIRAFINNEEKIVELIETAAETLWIGPMEECLKKLQSGEIRASTSGGYFKNMISKASVALKSTPMQMTVDFMREQKAKVSGLSNELKNRLQRTYNAQARAITNTLVGKAIHYPIHMGCHYVAYRLTGAIASTLDNSDESENATHFMSNVHTVAYVAYMTITLASAYSDAKNWYERRTQEAARVANMHVSIEAIIDKTESCLAPAKKLLWKSQFKEEYEKGKQLFIKELQNIIVQQLTPRVDVANQC